MSNLLLEIMPGVLVQRTMYGETSPGVIGESAPRVELRRLKHGYR